MARPLIDLSEIPGHPPLKELAFQDPANIERTVDMLNEHALALDAIEATGTGSATGYLFVADGTGATDVSADLEAAIEAAAAQKLPLVVQAGTYLLSNTVNVTDSDVTIVGYGNPTFVFASTARVGVLIVANTSRVHIQGVTFQGDDNDDFTQNLYPAIQQNDNTCDVTVARCRFEKCIPVQAYDSHNTRRLRFLQNYVHNQPNGLHPPSDSTIFDNDFICDAVVTTRAQAIYAWGQQTNIQIINNRFKNMRGQDIQIRSTSARFHQRGNFRIIGNHFENSNQASIWCGSDDHPLITAFVITSNTFLNCQGAITCYAYTAEIGNNHLEWNYEFPFTLPSLADAIIVSTAQGIVGHYQVPYGVHVHGNTLVVRHPYLASVSIDTIPANGDTLTIGQYVYTWKTTAAVDGDIQISVSTRQCAENLADTLRGNGVATKAPNNVIRFGTDVFSNYYGTAYGSGSDSIVYICGWYDFSGTFSKTGTSMTLSSVRDMRQSVQRAINVQNAIAPVIENNVMVDCSAPLINGCFEPTYRNNTLTDHTGVAAAYVGQANVYSHYSGNRVICPNKLTEGRRYYSSISDGFMVNDDEFIRPQQLTNPLGFGRTGMASAGDGKAYTLFWYGADIDSTTSGSLPFRWNDGDQVKLYNGASFFTFTFKRTAPGANEFNSADSLIALINAIGGTPYNASYVPFQADLGAANPKLMIKVAATAAGTGGNVHRMYVFRYTKPGLTTGHLTVAQPRTVGQMLRDVTGIQSGGTAETQSWFYGGAAAATKTFVFTPLANRNLPVIVTGIDATSRALNPYVDQADVIPGVGFHITHSAAAGTEKFLWRVG